MIQIKHEFGLLFIMKIHSDAERHLVLVPTGIALGRGFQKVLIKYAILQKMQKFSFVYLLAGDEKC